MISIKLLEEKPVEEFPEVGSMDDVMFQLSQAHNNRCILTGRIKDLNRDLEEAQSDLAYAEKAFEHYADLLEIYRKGNRDETAG